MFDDGSSGVGPLVRLYFSAHHHSRNYTQSVHVCTHTTAVASPANLIFTSFASGTHLWTTVELKPARETPVKDRLISMEP